MLWLMEGNDVLEVMVGAGNESANDTQVGFVTMHCILLWQMPAACPSTWYVVSLGALFIPRDQVFEIADRNSGTEGKRVS